MREFAIRLRSVQDVQDFVALSTARPFPVIVSNGLHEVNGKSFMEMFSLNFSYPLTAAADCSDEELQQFLLDAQRFLAK